MSKLRILFVDDSREDVEIACWQLERAGLALTPSSVCSEQELTAALQRELPDLIVSDFCMPSFDGWAALLIVQKLAPAIPFIFHSGSVDDESFREALARGAYGCVNKERADAFVKLVQDAARSVAPDECPSLLAGPTLIPG